MQSLENPRANAVSQRCAKSKGTNGFNILERSRLKSLDFSPVACEIFLSEGSMRAVKHDLLMPVTECATTRIECIDGVFREIY